MNDQSRLFDAFHLRFLSRFPLQAARKIERVEPNVVAPALARVPVRLLPPVFRFLLPQSAARLLMALPDAAADRLLAELPAHLAVRILGHLQEEERAARLGRLDETLRDDLGTLLSYRAGTAGREMDRRVEVFRADQTGRQALSQLRNAGMKTARSLFLVDDENCLIGKVALADIALASPRAKLEALAQPVYAAVRATDPLSEVSRIFESGRVLDLPVIDLDGVFLGAITHDQLAHTIARDAASDLQTMVGASKDERALSSVWFTVRARLPWLQINLVTAFMAAAVVGIFENTIAQVTALAVLLPVVAGQSGNTGAQALAVTMRGLALREITVRQGSRVMRKEVLAGLTNGLAVALTCGIGVYLWSGSLGLVAVIMSAMVIAMIAAGFAGATIPMILTRLGQDPATSSSIILTTVTDIAGFFAFLGIASLLMDML